MSIKSVKNLTLYIYSKPIHLLKTVPKKCFIIYSTRITTISTLDQVAEWCLNMQQVISEHILNQRILFYFYWLVWPTKYLLFYFNETALYVYLRLYVSLVGFFYYWLKWWNLLSCPGKVQKFWPLKAIKATRPKKAKKVKKINMAQNA